MGAICLFTCLFVFYYLEQMAGGSVSLWGIWELLEDSRGHIATALLSVWLQLTSKRGGTDSVSRLWLCPGERRNMRVFPPCQALPDGKV